MILLQTPRGLPVQVPETAQEDVSPKFAFDDTAAIRAHFEEHGFVVARGIFSNDTCDHMRLLWEREIKPSADFIYRQSTARAERHVFNSNHWVMNPILNLQSVDPRRYPDFRRYATENILAASRMKRVFTTLFGGESPKIVQSMYFEGNSATWEHQDSYYLDSEHAGEMAAAWVALEDIAAKAGRFFICPGSHRIEFCKQRLRNNVVDRHEVYIQSVVARIRELNLEIRAPRLEKGDVLFWAARTIHGSLDSQDARHSRSSITCHAIPDSHRFLQLQTRIVPLALDTVKDVRIHRPKDLARFRNRIVFAAETRFPQSFYGLKKFLIKAMLWIDELRAIASCAIGASPTRD